MQLAGTCAKPDERGWLHDIAAQSEGCGRPVTCHLAVTTGAQAYSCQARKAVFMPSALPPVVLFVGQGLAEQQVLTIVNVAGQGAAGELYCMRGFSH